MKDFRAILKGKEDNLRKVNRFIFDYRVKSRKVGLTLEDRQAYYKLRMLRIKLKKQVKDLKVKIDTL